MVEHEPGGERLNLLGRSVPSGFDVHVVVLWPGCERPFEAAEWRDALVEVDRGQVDIEFCSGARRRFGPGDLLWLAGLDLRALRNREHWDNEADEYQAVHGPQLNVDDLTIPAIVVSTS
jgi:hypothetical protein